MTFNLHVAYDNDPEFVLVKTHDSYVRGDGFSLVGMKPRLSDLG